ncbi:MAG TPA: cytoplasmic protein [bacterium]|nr:cytoplasmic protein [bacterium]
MKKVALFAFQGDLTCFIHVLLNALDMSEKGYAVKIIFEGASTTLIEKLATEGNPAAALYKKVKEKSLIEGVCKACAAKLGALDAAKSEGLTMLDELKGHPSMTRYIDEGYSIITF